MVAQMVAQIVALSLLSSHFLARAEQCSVNTLRSNDANGREASFQWIPLRNDGRGSKRISSY